MAMKYLGILFGAFLRGAFILLTLIGIIFTASDLYVGSPLSYILGSDIEMAGAGVIGFGIMWFYSRIKRKRSLRTKVMGEIEDFLSQPNEVLNFDDHTLKFIDYTLNMVKANKVSLTELDHINGIMERHKQRVGSLSVLHPA